MKIPRAIDTDDSPANLPPVRLARTIIDDAIRRTLPASLSELCDATGTSKPAMSRHLKRLGRLGCVWRLAAGYGAPDRWFEADGATWAHLARQGVTL